MACVVFVPFLGARHNGGCVSDLNLKEIKVMFLEFCRKYRRIHVYRLSFQNSAPNGNYCKSKEFALRLVSFNNYVMRDEILMVQDFLFEDFNRESNEKLQGKK